MTITFLFVSYILLIIIILFMPKRITIQEAYMTFVVVSLQTILADLIFSSVFHFYYIFDKEGPQLIAILTEFTLPSLFGIIYVNFIPKGTKKLILYLIFWVILSMVYELISRFFHYITFEGWKSWFSVVFYIYACLFMIWHIRFIRKGKIHKMDTTYDKH